MRKPFKKSLQDIPTEDAHGGSGQRKLILSKDDDVSPQFEAMTKAFLAAGGVFDWHQHENVDEFFIVIEGSGFIEFRDGSRFDYTKDDIIYIPANTEHRIENTGDTENQCYFVRLNT